MSFKQYNGSAPAGTYFAWYGINEGTEQHDFGVFDTTKTYGAREVGAQIAFAIVTFVEGKRLSNYKDWQGNDHYYGEASIPAGTYFAWYGKATRAGEFFGPPQGWHYCTTEAERNKEVVKYLKSAKARAIKQHGVAAQPRDYLLPGV